MQIQVPDTVVDAATYTYPLLQTHSFEFRMVAKGGLVLVGQFPDEIQGNYVLDVPNW